MKIKTKLRLAFGFLFLIILFFGGITLFYLNEISINAKVILKDNYETLKFTREMREILDENTLPLGKPAAEKFEKQLVFEENNLTEKGETEVVKELRIEYKNMINPNLPLAQKQEIVKQARLHLRTIEKLNMDAIVRKNQIAQKSVEKSTAYLAFVGGITFLILFSFIVNFPGFIANPLRELTDGIKEISNKNYHQRLNFKLNDEFGEVAQSFNQMANRLDEWENSNLAKIKSEKLRIEAIIEQMQDAIIGLNEKQKILFINSVAAQLLNLNEKNIIGQNAMSLALKNDLLKSILEDQKVNKPLKIYANNKESYFDLESREIRVPDYEKQEEDDINILEKSAGKVYILRNITRFKELDEAKTNFIATISHELKTPISSLKMSLRLLDDERIGELNNEQAELLKHMTDDTNRLLNITGELLDMAQVETGNIQLNFAPTDPGEIVDYAVDAVLLQAKHKSINLDIKMDPVLGKVQADVEKTAWVLVNFLSNALRYSAEKSKVILEVHQKGNMIEFLVQDFGKGIEEKYQKHLFDRYFQVPTDGKNKSGTGLGLAISKDFIEAQKGEIFVESELGTGSKFGFSLPVAI
ncbi:MAG: ATP-binding protein [Daejeonella sp.]